MKRLYTVKSFIFCGISLFLFSSCDKNNEVEAEKTNENSILVTQDWPIFRGDAELHGESKEDLKYPLKMVWSFTPKVLEGKRAIPFDATPVISDGVVYIGDQSGLFYAIDLASGQKLWHFEAESGIAGPAAVFGARVFFGDTGGIFYALNIETGLQVWTYEVEGKIEGGPNLLNTEDGIVRVFFGSEDTYLYCLNGDNGELLWKHETDNQVIATPSIVNSGGEQAVVFGGCDGVLHIVPVVQTKAGDENSSEPTNISSSIEVGSYIANSSSVRDGIAYVAHDGGEVVAVDIAAKKVLWRVETGFQYRGCSAAVSDQYLYVPSNKKKLTTYDRTTSDVVWEFQGRKSFESSPVITKSAIWQAGIDGFLYAIDPKLGEEKWSWEVGERLKSSPAISNGKLVIASQSGSVYAFESEPNPEDE